MHAIRALAFTALALTIAACGANESASETVETTAASAPAATPQVSASTAELPLLVVHKTPWCGCCTIWAEQAEAAGFAVELRDIDDLTPIKEALGVPMSQASCHTAEIDGYFVEGHVPFEDIHRMLADRPAARGIAVPGMPLGSPGMEAHVKHTFTTNLVADDGSVVEYALHPGDDHAH